jgi:hypothetical protein
MGSLPTAPATPYLPQARQSQQACHEDRLHVCCGTGDLNVQATNGECGRGTEVLHVNEHSRVTRHSRSAHFSLWPVALEALAAKSNIEARLSVLSGGYEGSLLSSSAGRAAADGAWPSSRWSGSASQQHHFLSGACTPVVLVKVPAGEMSSVALPEMCEPAAHAASCPQGGRWRGLTGISGALVGGPVSAV